MQKIILMFLITLFSCSKKELIYQVPEFAEGRVVNDKDLERIIEVLKTEQLEVYDKKRAVPKSILKTLNKWGNGKIRFADRGEKYRETDFVINSGTPNRQIITILKSTKYFVMTYNHGGRGFHGHILFCNLVEGEVAGNIWVVDSTKGLASKEEIIKELTNVSKRPHTNFICY